MTETIHPRSSRKGSRNYYFLAASLEDVRWGQDPPSGPTEQVLEFIRNELHPEDLQATRELFLFNDMRNAVAYHGPDDQFRSPSCYRRAEILEAAEGDKSVLPFLVEFFESVRSGNRIYPDIPQINELTILFFDHLDDIGSDFVRDFYLHELEVRNLSIAISRQQQGFPYRERLIPRGDVYEAVMSGNPPDFGLSRDFPFVDRLVNVFHTTDLTAHEQAMEEILWQWIDDRVGPNFFSAEYILGYILKYQSVERWAGLSDEKGDEVFGELVNAVQRSVRFALEFSVGDKEKDDDKGNSNRD